MKARRSPLLFAPRLIVLTALSLFAPPLISPLTGPLPSSAVIVQLFSPAVAIAKPAQNRRGNRARKRGGGGGGGRAAKGFEKGLRKGGLAGIRLGFTMSWLNATREADPFLQDPGVGVGFHGGVTYDRAFNKIFGIRLGGNFSQRSFSHRSVSNHGYDEDREVYTISEDSKYEESETTLNTLEIPFSLQFRFNHGSKMRPFAYLGGYASMLFVANGTHEESGNNDEARAPFSSLDAGWLLGGGVYWVLPPGSGFLSTDLRLSGSLGNIADTDMEVNQAGGGTESLKQQIYQPFTMLFALTYHFSL